MKNYKSAVLPFLGMLLVPSIFAILIALGKFQPLLFITLTVLFIYFVFMFTNAKKLN